VETWFCELPFRTADSGNYNWEQILLAKRWQQLSGGLLAHIPFDSMLNQFPRAAQRKLLLYMRLI
jgi:hypothetical protein